MGTFEDNTMQWVNIYTGDKGPKIDVYPDSSDIDLAGDHVAVLSNKGLDTDDDGGYLGGVTIAFGRCEPGSFVTSSYEFVHTQWVCVCNKQ